MKTEKKKKGKKVLYTYEALFAVTKNIGVLKRGAKSRKEEAGCKVSSSTAAKDRNVQTETADQTEASAVDTAVSYHMSRW